MNRRNLLKALACIPFIGLTEWKHDPHKITVSHKIVNDRRNEIHIETNSHDSLLCRKFWKATVRSKKEASDFIKKASLLDIICAISKSEYLSFEIYGIKFSLYRIVFV